MALETIYLRRRQGLSRANGPDKANPFHETHYILLNLAIGGANGGDPCPTEFPARFEIDYVRVYQKPLTPH